MGSDALMHADGAVRVEGKNESGRPLAGPPVVVETARNPRSGILNEAGGRPGGARRPAYSLLSRVRRNSSAASNAEARATRSSPGLRASRIFCSSLSCSAV